MLNKFLTILLIVLISWNVLPFYNSHVDEELQPIYKGYTNLLDLYCPTKVVKSHQIILIDGLSKDLLGVCYSNFNKFTIVIDKTSWKQLTYMEQKTVLYHELSHCILTTYGIIARPHTDNPRHYMYPSLSNNIIWDLQDQVIEDIKTRCD